MQSDSNVNIPINNLAATIPLHASVLIYSHRYIKVKIMSIIIHSAIDNGKHTAYCTLKRMAFNQDVCGLPRSDLIS